MTPTAAPSAAALTPLAARYGHWLALSQQEVLINRDAAEREVRSMPLILRLERDSVVSRYRALELAATGAALICLDERSEPGGEWFEPVRDYCLGHIRKVTRRARGREWEATGALAGLSLASATEGVPAGGSSTEVRALVPGLVSELDKRVSKLQVGGTELPWDSQEPVPPPGGRPSDGEVLELWIPELPPMTAGKQMAQTGHAGMIAAALLAGDGPGTLAAWAAAGCPSVVHRADPHRWSSLTAKLIEPEKAWRTEHLLGVRDAGFTEIPAGSLTVIARAPR